MGRPLASDIEGFTGELKSADAKSLLIFDNPDIVKKLREDVRYIHTATIYLSDGKRYVNAVNTNQDLIKSWDKEVNIFALRGKQENAAL